MSGFCDLQVKRLGGLCTPVSEHLHSKAAHWIGKEDFGLKFYFSPSINRFYAMTVFDQRIPDPEDAKRLIAITARRRSQIPTRVRSIPAPPILACLKTTMSNA